MAQLFEPTIDEQIASVEREISMRERVYPRWVDSQKITQAKADREIETMKAVSRTLHSYKSIAGAV